MQEFCRHGYMGASLRTISENAGTTPRSIYTRYGDKEGLFSALVSACAGTLKDLIGNYMEGYAARPADEQKMLFHDEKFDAEYQGYIRAIMDYIYDNRDVVKLLVCGSEGSKYAGFVDERAATRARKPRRTRPKGNQPRPRQSKPWQTQRNQPRPRQSKPWQTQRNQPKPRRTQPRKDAPAVFSTH